MAVKENEKIVKLSDADVFCYICRGILIEPVTVPCEHVFCKTCLENSLQETSYSCPLCRRRISNWLRSAKKSDKLLNSDLWEQIKAQYKDEVNSKLSGLDDGLDERIQHTFAAKKIVTPTGLIHKEYSQYLNEYNEQLRLDQVKQEAESLEFIKRLQEEEEQQHLNEDKEQLRLDQEKQEAENLEFIKRLEEEERQQAMEEALNFAAALKLQKEENKRNKVKTSLTSSISKRSYNTRKSTAKTRDKKPVCGPMDFHIKRLSGPSSTAVERCPSSESNDSISPEMKHFKPIKAEPKTPPKDIHDGEITDITTVTPIKLFRANAKFTASILNDSNRTILSDLSAFKGIPSPILIGGGMSEAKMEFVVGPVAQSEILREINVGENSVGVVVKTECDSETLDEAIAIKKPKHSMPLTDTENLQKLFDKEEQRRREQRLLQVKADHKFALQLSRKWGRSYQLRRIRTRQPTIVEVVSRQNK